MIEEGTSSYTLNIPAEAETREDPERWVHLQFTWSTKSFTLDIADSDRVFDLKAAIQTLTRVPPERQKILGLVKGKLPPDQDRISDLRLVSGKKFVLVGTPEGDEIKDPSQLENLPDVVNDFDVDFSDNLDASVAYKNDQRNIRKIKEATDNLNVNIIHSLRPGKKLLVLDIDYTILDTKPLTSGSLPPAECARPFLHEFLEAIYPYYDSRFPIQAEQRRTLTAAIVCIWFVSLRSRIPFQTSSRYRSQTSWIWLETKLVELGMIGSNRNYQISFVLDKTCMFTVFTERDGRPWNHQVKPLQIIWNKFPNYNAANTIHVDDLVSTTND
ncbi:hypothetical protein H2248_009298 [Termitomyces sp. 'cryptogamus']|nr:hypothetical protein H2248_009298 [Termitomyces sp. 'cryptogamus']